MGQAAFKRFCKDCTGSCQSGPEVELREAEVLVDMELPSLLTAKASRVGSRSPKLQSYSPGDEGASDAVFFFEEDQAPLQSPVESKPDMSSISQSSETPEELPVEHSGIYREMKAEETLQETSPLAASDPMSSLQAEESCAAAESCTAPSRKGASQDLPSSECGRAKDEEESTATLDVGLALRRARAEREANEKLRVFLRDNGFAGVCDSRRWLMKTYYPLHVAVKQNNVMMVQLLLRRGADPRQANSSRQTPYEYALCCSKHGSHKEVLTLLRRYEAMGC